MNRSNSRLLIVLDAQGRTIETEASVKTLSIASYCLLRMYWVPMLVPMLACQEITCSGYGQLSESVQPVKPPTTCPPHVTCSRLPLKLRHNQHASVPAQRMCSPSCDRSTSGDTRYARAQQPPADWHMPSSTYFAGAISSRQGSPGPFQDRTTVHA